MKKPEFINEMVKEAKRIVDTRSLMLITVVVPPILFFLFAYIYQSALVRQIPISIIDHDNSVISRTAITSFGASPSFTIKTYYASLEEAKAGLISGEVDGIVFIPKNFERDIKKGRQVHPVIFANGINVIKSNYIMSDATKIFKMISGGVLLKKFRSSGMTETQAMEIINPVRYDFQTLYNSNYNCVDFLVPSLCVFVIFMSLSLAGATVFNHEKIDAGVLTSQIKFPVGSVFGRLLPYVLISAADAMVMIGLIFPIFSITMRGSAFELMLFTFIFGITSVLLGMVVSAIIKNLMMATQVILFFTTPAFVFSGLTYPIWAMPGTHQIFANIIPYTHFLDGFIRIYLMGESLGELGMPLNLLVGGTLISFGLLVLILEFQSVWYLRKVGAKV
ncbi:MAG: ABC transporter permease [Ignavibacteriaceae bacterium]|nr:ABC transporter permease [Ignavibacteriaceae bacterium]